MLSLFAGIFEIFWRRLFGGWLEDIPIISSRIFQHVTNCLVLGGLLFLSGLVWWKILASLVIIEGFYWGKGHGCMFDLGHHGKPDETMVKRYKKQWGYNTLCKIFPESLWYGYWFDTTLMYIRYTLPSLSLIPFFGWEIGVSGLLGVVYGYQLGWWLQDKGFLFLNNRLKGLCSCATNFGEMVCGFWLGALLLI